MNKNNNWTTWFRCGNGKIGKEVEIMLVIVGLHTPFMLLIAWAGLSPFLSFMLFAIMFTLREPIYRLCGGGKDAHNG